MKIEKDYLSIGSTNVSIEFEDDAVKIYEKKHCIYDINAESLLFIDIYDIECPDELYDVQLYLIGFKISPSSFTIVHLSYLYYIYGRGNDFKYLAYEDRRENIIFKELIEFVKRNKYSKKYQFSVNQYERRKYRDDVDKSLYDINRYIRNYNNLDFVNSDSKFYKGHVRTISRNNGGCYIATCVYGSYDCPEVWTLRRYRDYELSKSSLGRLFIRVYYFLSPTIVKLFGNTIWFKNFWRRKLNRMVMKCNEKGYTNLPYDDINW